MCDLAQPRVRLFGRANTVRSHKRREAACGGGQGNERSGTASVASLSPGTANPDARAFFRRLSCDRRLPLPADKSSQGLARAYFAVRVRVSPSLLARLQPQELCPALPCESIFLVTPPPSSLGPLLTLSSSPLQLSSFPRLHTLCPCLLSSSSFISARLALDLVARRDIGAAPERAASLQAFHPPSIKAVATVTCISLPRVHLYHPPPPPIPPHPLVGSDVQRQR